MGAQYGAFLNTNSSVVVKVVFLNLAQLALAQLVTLAKLGRPG